MILLVRLSFKLTECCMSLIIIPQVYEFARLNITFTVLSKRRLLKLVKQVIDVFASALLLSRTRLSIALSLFPCLQLRSEVP